MSPSEEAKVDALIRYIEWLRDQRRAAKGQTGEPPWGHPTPLWRDPDTDLPW